MSITALPKSTIHLLGSTQTLTNAHSLVKELVDNAIDAKATTVDVLLSKDTLEKIEVRDNGHGISQDDFDALGRRGYTSKLRSFDELKFVGGLSLGFRGEALASAVQLGDVTVTTKTEGEAVATCITLKYPGGVAKQTKSSHPVGTTISVKNFISKIPVRKQTALKAAPKTLLQIKELLQAYAFARPNIKFTLRVVKEAKGSWSYVPRRNEGIKGTATQIVGREVVAECVERTISFASKATIHIEQLDQSEDEGADVEARNDKFTIEMLLPKPAADVSKIGSGQFLSVDGRPVAIDKGTMKRIMTLFKSSLKASYGTSRDAVKNPFIRMNIVCPFASYDANVEPAKDDILFACEYLLLNSIEDFFKDMYGEVTTAGRSTRKSDLSEDGFELLLARASPDTHIVARNQNAPGLSGSIIPPEIDRVGDEKETDFMSGVQKVTNPIETRNKWGVDMSNELFEDAEGIELSHKPMLQHAPEDSEVDEEDAEPASSGLNPWVIAKLTAPSRSHNEALCELPLLATNSNELSSALPTPEQSSDPMTRGAYEGTPISTALQYRRFAALEERRVPQVSQPSGHFSRETTAFPLDPQVPPHSMVGIQDDFNDMASNDPAVVLNTRRSDFISARNLTEDDIVMPSFPESVKLPKRSHARVNKPFISPLQHVKAPLVAPVRQTLRQSTLDGSNPPESHNEARPERSGQDDHDADLAWAMEFEHRKEELSRQQKQHRKAIQRRVVSDNENSNEGGIRSRSSPHRNRYVAATAVLDRDLSTIPALPGPKLSIPDGDPRSYLIRRQKSHAAQPDRPLRLKSNRLPLERVPEGSQLNSLALHVSTRTVVINELAERFAQQDSYIRSGALARGLPLDAQDVQRTAQTLETKVGAWKERMTEGDLELEFTVDGWGAIENELS